MSAAQRPADPAGAPPSDSAGAAPLAATLRRLAAHPGFRQLLGLAGVAAAIAVGLTIWFWSQSSGMVPLFTGMSPGDEMAVLDTLRAQQVPFEQAPGSGSVLVPAERVHELRLALAAEGLPRGSGVGFELIRDGGGLGSSPFMESARYQHVLETELARTIGTMHPVRSARVHLAMPRRSAFVRPKQQASAAVMVSLHPGRTLEPGQVAAIVHLVSSAVPALGQDSVSVVDQRGGLLSRPRGEGQGLDAEQLAYQARLEERYLQRVLQLLAPLTGAERVSAQVTVDLDFSRAEQTRESYDPDSRTLRSEQLAEQRDGAGAAAGVPGALSNRPPTAAETAAGEGEAGGRRSLQSTRNYEINRTIEQTWQQPGRLRRISAAVVVDHLPDAQGAAQPLDAEQMQRIESLVREAIGFDEARGDSVNVQNLRFQTPAPLEPDSPPIWEQAWAQDLARQLLGLAVLLLVAFRLFRPAVRAVLQAPPAPPALSQSGAAGAQAGRGGAPLAVEGSDPQALEGAGLDADGRPIVRRGSLDTGEPLEGYTPDAQRVRNAALFEDKLVMAREAVEQDPARVANVVRGWIANE